jgi:hypothetical protein
MRLFLAAIFLAALSILAFAQDEPEDDFSVQGSNLLRYDEGDEVNFLTPGIAHPDNMLRRRFFENRLRLDLTKGALHGGVRWLHFRPSQNDQEQYGLAAESRIDKRFVEGTYHPVSLRLGHFSDLWAHGLVFSSFENRDLYFDSELDGVRAQLEGGPLRLTGIRGASAEGLLVKHAELTGGRTEWRGGDLGMGFSYLNIDSGYYAESHVSGVDLKVSRGPVAFSAERAWNETFSSGASAEGHATYIGVVLSKWNWSLLLDYKDYDYGYATPFQNPPIGYREVGPRVLQGREPHVMNIPNEVGYQAELSGQVRPTTYATLHYHRTSRHAADDPALPLPTLEQEDAPFWEGFVNLSHDLPASRAVFVELGANEEAATTWQKRKWVQARFTTPFRAKHELEFEVEELLITDVIRDDEKYLDQFYSLGWSSGKLSLVGIYQTTNDDELKRREGNGWPSVEAAVTLGEEDRHRMILFYGRERGGLKCSNGVCRQVQAFEGFRLTLETSL